MSEPMIRHNTASAAVIDEHDHVLLVQHHKSGLWLYPGGHIDDNEDPAQAVVREVKEETGIDVDIVTDNRFTYPGVGIIANPFAIIEMPVSDKHIGPHRHIDFVYACRPASGDLQPQMEEVGAARWIPLSDIADLRVPDELPALLAAAAKYLHEH